MYKHYFLCLSKTYLYSSTPDSLLKIDGYNLVSAGHPNNIKRGGVCIYYKESLPVQYFVEHCTLLKNSSVLPINQTFLTQLRLTSLDFNEEEIFKIIRALSTNKARGHDISIRMIKICDKPLLKP